MTEAFASVEDRIARGHSARSGVPRSSHGEWKAPDERTDPVELLRAQAVDRVPELMPLRHERMLVSPFTFYRGAAAIMAADLADTPTSGVRVQCCGDAHLSNFGGFAAPDRADGLRHQRLRRNAAGSVGVGHQAARRELRGSQIGSTASRTGAESFAAPTARTRPQGHARVRRHEEARRLVFAARHQGVFDRCVPGCRRRTRSGSRAALQKARGEGRSQGVRRVDRASAGECGSRTIRLGVAARGPVAGLGRRGELTSVRERCRSRGTSRSLPRPIARHLLEGYRLVDIARKVVGVGSVGTRCWIGLMLGRDDDDPLLLQVKEAQASVLEPYGQEQVQEPRPAGRRGPAAHAGGERHPARLGPRRRYRRHDPRLSPSVNSGTEGSRPTGRR